MLWIDFLRYGDVATITALRARLSDHPGTGDGSSDPCRAGARYQYIGTRYDRRQLFFFRDKMHCFTNFL
jgi:hypothetical protein